MTEYMTAQEALAWVETGNADFASAVANDGPHRYAISLAMWEQEKRGRARKTHRALRLLKERCASGRILAYARPIRSDRRELVKGADWIGLKLTMDFELATTHGTPLFVEPVFRRKDVLLQFPPPARGSRPDLSAVPTIAAVGADDRTEASAIDAPPTIESWPDVEDKGAEGLPWFAAADDETGVLPTIESGPEVEDKASAIEAAPRKPHRGAESLASDDAPFVEMMRALCLEHHTVNAAAGIVFEENKAKIRRQPRASDDSVIRRLRNRYTARYPAGV